MPRWQCAFESGFLVEDVSPHLPDIHVSFDLCSQVSTAVMQFVISLDFRWRRAGELGTVTLLTAHWKEQETPSGAQTT